MNIVRTFDILPSIMKIHHKADSLSISKPEGINVNYYLFPEYEVHYNEQNPNSIQTWHHHEKIWESLYIIEGELVAQWKENGVEKSEIIKTGDLIETERTSHTFSNRSDKTVKFLVIKRVPTGEDFKDILKSDKIIDE